MSLLLQDNRAFPGFCLIVSKQLFDWSNHRTVFRSGPEKQQHFAVTLRCVGAPYRPNRTNNQTIVNANQEEKVQGARHGVKSENCRNTRKLGNQSEGTQLRETTRQRTKED